MTENFKSQAHKYEASREAFRSKARHDFLSFHEDSNELIITLNEIVARHMFFASEKSLKHVENGDYFSKLIVSFTRTHFILYDLTICNELIDASVLFRKQLELVSRLVELDSNIDISKLIKKTPNVKHLEFDLNRHYTDYTQLAHSSVSDKMELLGRAKGESGYFTAVFPEFDENSYVSFRHLFLLVTQYHYWITEKYSVWFTDYDKQIDCSLFTRSYKAFNNIFYENPKFQKIGSGK
jgi:hypothetical protein